MSIDIETAKKDVSEMYKSLQPTIKAIVDKHSKEIDNIILKIKKNFDTLTNKEIHDFMLQLGIETYYFSQIKDMSILKQECATALLKESQANSFNGTEGTQAIRSNQAIIDSLDKQVVSLMQNAIANLMKTKLDEAHRMINILSGVLISKNAENKLRGVKDGENLHSDSISEDKAF